MGCDYYISLSLRISFKKKTDEYHQPNIHLNLETRNGYFSYSGLGDEDEIGYEEKLKKYKEDCLTVKAKPILIYENGEFIKPSLKLKNPKVFKAERFPDSGNALKRAEDCAICYEGIQLVDSVTLNCGHRFCVSCVRSTLRACERELPECALCRREINTFVVKSRDVYDSLTQFCQFL